MEVLGPRVCGIKEVPFVSNVRELPGIEPPRVQGYQANGSQDEADRLHAGDRDADPDPAPPFPGKEGGGGTDQQSQEDQRESGVIVKTASLRQREEPDRRKGQRRHEPPIGGFPTRTCQARILRRT